MLTGALVIRNEFAGDEPYKNRNKKLCSHFYFKTINQKYLRL